MSIPFSRILIRIVSVLYIFVQTSQTVKMSGQQIRVYFNQKWQPGNIVHEESKNGVKVFKVKYNDGVEAVVNTKLDKYIIIRNVTSDEAEVVVDEPEVSGAGAASEAELADASGSTEPGNAGSPKEAVVNPPPAPAPRWDENIMVSILDKEVYVELDRKGLPWCRYCGARDTSGWSRGPWASKTLCIPHYVAWWQKKKLDLSAYADALPTQPINPHENTEFKYTAWKKEKQRKIERQKLQAQAQKPATSGIDEAEFAQFAEKERSAAEKSGRRISSRAIRTKFVKMKEEKERGIKMKELKKQEEIEEAGKRERRRQLEAQRRLERERMEALRQDRKREQARRKKETEDLKLSRKRERETKVKLAVKSKRVKVEKKRERQAALEEEANGRNKVSWTATASDESPPPPQEPMGLFWTRPRRA